MRGNQGVYHAQDWNDDGRTQCSHKEGMHTTKLAMFQCAIGCARSAGAPRDQGMRQGCEKATRAERIARIVAMRFRSLFPWFLLLARVNVVDGAAGKTTAGTEDVDKETASKEISGRRP